MLRFKAAWLLPLALAALAVAQPSQVRAQLVGFKPTMFIEEPSAPFFYSVGAKVKFGKVINENSPALFDTSSSKSVISAVLVSPDEKKAAIVSGGNLYIGEAGKPPLLLLENVHAQHDVYASDSALQPGDTIIKYWQLQWTADSRVIYVPRDKKQARASYSYFSRDAVLLRIDTSNPANVAEVVQDFRSLKYFLLGENALCFDYAPGDGSVIWKCLHEGGVKGARSIEGNRVLLDDGSSIVGRPFVSYWGNDVRVWLSRSGFSFKIMDGYTRLFAKEQTSMPIISIKGATNFKGTYSAGLDQYCCNVLPGGQYALISLQQSNFKGQLLVDGVTGKYRKLPRDTRVYRNLNSFDYEDVDIRVAPGGGSLDFLPHGELRPRLDRIEGEQRSREPR